MKHNTRRSFIKGSAIAGLAASAPLAVLAGPVSLTGVDRPVADVLASYGVPRAVEAKSGVARISVDVNGTGQFAKSFERFTGISDHVRIENDDVTFAYGKTTYIIENRVA